MIPELGRRRMLQVMGAGVVVVLLDGLAAGADTGAPADGALSPDTLRLAADRYNGAYVAKWVDSTGKTGTGSGHLAIDPTAQRVQASMGFGGKILGRSGLTKQTMTADLTKYDDNAETLSVAKTPIGAVHVERVSGGAKFALAAIPGPGRRLDGGGPRPLHRAEVRHVHIYDQAPLGHTGTRGRELRSERR